MGTHQRAFTLVELVAILTAVVMLTAMVSPAARRSRIVGDSARCLNNQRQLLRAWRMYAQDNADALPFARSSSSPNSAYSWVKGILDSYNPSWRDNWDPDSTLGKGALWPYCGNSFSIFHCPADSSFGIDPQGQRIPRRSVSMNNWVGGDGDSPQNGYKGQWGLNSPAVVVRKLSQFRNPGPARTFVFLDEHAQSINEGYFVTEVDGYPNPATTKIVDYPAAYHHAAAGFGFADGHAETHRWRDRRTTPSPTGVLSLNVPSPNNPDVLWLQSHAAGLP